MDYTELVKGLREHAERFDYDGWVDAAKSGKCYDACFRYWAKNQYSPLFICPGCETWSDKDGKTWWRVNLPDGIEIHPMEVDNG